MAKYTNLAYKNMLIYLSNIDIKLIEGRLTRLAYISLYRSHQQKLHGCFKTGLIILIGRLNRFIHPSLKLH